MTIIAAVNHKVDTVNLSKCQSSLRAKLANLFFQGKYGNKRFVLHSFIHSFYLNPVPCPVHVVVHMVAIQLQRKRDK